jgi:hypothetical protein
LRSSSIHIEYSVLLLKLFFFHERNASPEVNTANGGVLQLRNHPKFYSMGAGVYILYITIVAVYQQQLAPVSYLQTDRDRGLYNYNDYNHYIIIRMAC